MINLHQEAIVKVNIHASDVKTFMSKEMIETIIEMTTKNLRATLEGVNDFDFLDKVSDEPLVLTTGGLLQLNIVRKPKQDVACKTKCAKTSVPFSGRVSYIMDRILDILIIHTKKVFKKDFVPVSCYYTDDNKKPAVLLDFKGVDISGFSKFDFGITGTRINIVKVIDRTDFVEYLILDVKCGRGLAFITISKDECKFSIVTSTDNPVMSSAFPKIEEICEAFNSDKSENNN